MQFDVFDVAYYGFVLGFYPYEGESQFVGVETYQIKFGGGSCLWLGIFNHSTVSMNYVRRLVVYFDETSFTYYRSYSRHNVTARVHDEVAT